MSDFNVINSVKEKTEGEQAEYYQGLADSCLSQGRVYAAIDYYLKTIQLRPIGGIPYLKLRYIPLNSTQLERAIEVYLRAAEQQPNYHEPHLSLAHAMTTKRNVSEACRFYQKATYCLNLGQNREWVEQHWKKADVEMSGKPNFLIIGAEKCGTSSLHYYITQHPQVLDSAEKEIYFFTHNLKYNQGKDWYFSHFPPISKGSEFIVGEASTSYIGCTNNAPQRVFEMLPEVKLLAVLRNPVDRAVSNYHQLVRLGRENRSLEEVMTTEMELLQGVNNPLSLRKDYWRVGKGCIWNSLYVYFLEQWLRVFPKKQFLILKSEELFECPEDTMKRVFEFLELPEFGQSDYQAVNSGGSYPQTEESIRKVMAEFFEPHNRKLEQFLGQTFDWKPTPTMPEHSVERPTKGEEYWQRGQAYREAGNLVEAISAYRQAVEAMPKKAEYHQSLGEVLAQDRQWEAAAKCYRKAIEWRSGWFKPHYRLGEALEKHGLVAQAIVSYRKAISLKSDFAWSHFRLGSLLEEQGLLEEAIAAYRTAIAVHPPDKSGWFYLQLGDALMKQGHLEEAMQSYREGDRVLPNSVDGKRKLGLAYAQQKNWEEAVVTYREAIERQPDLPQLHLELGEALEKQGLREEAIASYRRVLALKPNDAKCYQRLQQSLAKQAGRKDPELLDRYEAIEKTPDDPKLYLKLGKDLTKRGRLDEAVRCYLKAIDLQPNFTDAYLPLKHAALYYSDLDEVVAAYQRVIERQPNCFPVYVNLAGTLTQQGKIEAATEYYQQAIDLRTRLVFPEFVNLSEGKAHPRQPHFIIIGAEKCGTSSLHGYITQHPQVLDPVEKEIHFFTHHFDKGLDWYRSHFAPIPEASEYITGEASTSYIAGHNNAPQRLFELYPKVKLLAVLRDPVERAISHYNQLVKLGREGRSLEEVMNVEMEVLEGVEDIWSVGQEYWKIGQGSIWHSLYGFFLERWMGVFPKEQFLILRSEDLFGKPEATMKQVFEFLELPDYQLPSYPAYNAGGAYGEVAQVIRHRLENFFSTHSPRLKKLLGTKVEDDGKYKST